MKVVINSCLCDKMSMAHKEKLIDLVKLNAGLWKQNRKAPGLKQKLWDDIGLQMGTTGYDARRQWEILRDQLRRETKRFKQNPQYTSKWTFYNKMLFAQPQTDSIVLSRTDGGEQNTQNEQRPFLTPKCEEAQGIIKVRKDLQGQENNSNDGLSLHSPSINESTLTAAPEITEDYPTTSAGVSSSTQPPSNIKDDVDTSQMIRNKTKRYPMFPDDGDEDYYFAMSLVPSLRFIPRSKKLRIRSKIMDIIQLGLEDDCDDNYDIQCNEKYVLSERNQTM